MAVAVSVIVGVALLVALWALAVLLRRMFFGGGSGDGTTVNSTAAPPYGGLPDLGPVGPLGELSPDANIGDPGASPDDLLGH